jgi:ATP synthase I chain
MTADFHERSLHRMDRIALALGAAGVIGVFVNAGWRSAIGFASGSAISSVNFRLWKRLANSIGETGAETPSEGKAVLLGLRYLVMAGAVFGIIRLLEVSPWTVLAGLFVSVAAVLTELVCQLIFVRD